MSLSEWTVKNILHGKNFIKEKRNMLKNYNECYNKQV